VRSARSARLRNVCVRMAEGDEESKEETPQTLQGWKSMVCRKEADLPSSETRRNNKMERLGFVGGFGTVTKRSTRIGERCGGRVSFSVRSARSARLRNVCVRMAEGDEESKEETPQTLQGILIFVVTILIFGVAILATFSRSFLPGGLGPPL